MSSASKAQKEALPSVFTLPALQLRKMLAAAVLWSDTSGYRPHIGGVQFESDGPTLRLVSTNGCGLFHVESKLEEPAAPFVLNADGEDVADMLAILKRIARHSDNDNGAAAAAMAIADQSCRLTYGRLGLTVKHLGPGFPDWRKVIDVKRGERSKLVGLGTKFLLKVAKSFDSNGVKVEVNGSLDPVMFRGEIAECEAFVLLMPTRIA